MKRLVLVLSFLVASISVVVFNSTGLQSLLASLIPLQFNSPINTTKSTTTHLNLITPATTITKAPMLSNTAKATMAASIRHAKITPHRSATRGHSDHGWLNTYHSFSFADWYNPAFTSFGSLRVLNEDRVAANSGFPTHPHRDFEIFSYVLSGELTHRDSMLKKGAEGTDKDKFYRMRRGDVQFTTGGTGIAHSEMNEHHKDTVHFLQIWALPWKRGLPPNYHTRTFDEAAKRRGFVPILSPLKAGVEATGAEEKAAVPAIADTIPIHADFAMGAGIIAPEAAFEWTVGAKATTATKRKIYVHLPMTKGGKAQIRLDGREDAVLNEGDGAFIDSVNAGDKLKVESIGSAEAEVIVLDTA